MFYWLIDANSYAQFKERYLALTGDLNAKQASQAKKKKIHVLLQEFSNDEDTSFVAGPVMPEDPNRPWLQDFRAYLDIQEQVLEGWSTVKWWGVSDSRMLFPSWSSPDFTA